MNFCALAELHSRFAAPARLHREAKAKAAAGSPWIRTRLPFKGLLGRVSLSVLQPRKTAECPVEEKSLLMAL